MLPQIRCPITFRVLDSRITSDSKVTDKTIWKMIDVQ